MILKTEIDNLESESGKKLWAGYAAALWALVFAVLHLAWAAGWYVGLDAKQSQKAFDSPWFMAYDLIVAGMCLFAVPVALALVQPWGRRISRKLLGLFAWGGTSLLVLRSVASIIQMVSLIATRQFQHVAEPSTLWELWFYLGAVLFGLSTWRFWHAPKQQGE